MSLKKLILATVFSIPLLPFLIISEDSLTQPLTSNDFILAAPFVIEFMCFYFIFAFARQRSSVFNASEQKSLIVLALGLFALFALPVIYIAVSRSDIAVSNTGFLLTMVYAAVSLFVSVRKTVQSPKKVERFMHKAYTIPGIVALALFFALLNFAAVIINPVAAYFVIKNFTFAVK